MATTSTDTSTATVRILTRAGLALNDLRATVDIHDDPPGPNARSTARCRPCGRDFDHGLNFRHQVLDWAQQHADACTALPNT